MESLIYTDLHANFFEPFHPVTCTNTVRESALFYAGLDFVDTHKEIDWTKNTLFISVIDFGLNTSFGCIDALEVKNVRGIASFIVVPQYYDTPYITWEML